MCRDHVCKSSSFACTLQQLGTSQTCWSGYLKVSSPIYLFCLTGQSFYDLQESKLLHPVNYCSCENIRNFNYKSKLPQVNGTTDRDEEALMILVLASYVGITLIQQVVVSRLICMNFNILNILSCNFPKDYLSNLRGCLFFFLLL